MKYWQFFKGNKIDYYHFYIELPGKKVGEKKRSSPNFRKEAYKMDDYTLVAYIGDHDIVEKREETLKQKRDKILGSLSMHANLQEVAKNRTNSTKISGVRAIPGRGYNTISGKVDYLFKLYFLRRLEKRWACNNLVSWPRAFETLAYEGTKLFITISHLYIFCIWSSENGENMAFLTIW